jgi:outer membrane protein assembly factor BamB
MRYDTGINQPYLYALNVTDGSMRWRYLLSNDASLLGSGKTQFANGSVYLAQSSLIPNIETAHGLSA